MQERRQAMCDQKQNEIEAKIIRLRDLEEKQKRNFKREKQRKKGFIGIGIILLIVLMIFAIIQVTYIAGQYYTLRRQINIMDEQIKQLASDMRLQEDRIEERNINKNGEK